LGTAQSYATIYATPDNPPFFGQMLATNNYLIVGANTRHGKESTWVLSPAQERKVLLTQSDFFDFQKKDGTISRHNGCWTYTNFVPGFTADTLYVVVATGDDGQIWHLYSIPATGGGIFRDVTPKGLNAGIYQVQVWDSTHLLIYAGGDIWMSNDLTGEKPATKVVSYRDFLGDTPFGFPDLQARNGHAFVQWVFGGGSHRIGYIDPATLAFREVAVDTVPTFPPNSNSMSKVDIQTVGPKGGLIGNYPYTIGGRIFTDSLYLYNGTARTLLLAYRVNLLGKALAYRYDNPPYYDVVGGIKSGTVTMADDGSIYFFGAYSTIVGNTVSNEFLLTKLTPPPALSSVRPTSVQAGQSFELTGSNLSVPGATTSVSLSGLPAVSCPTVSDSRLVCNLPAGYPPTAGAALSVAVSDSKGRKLTSNALALNTLPLPTPTLTASPFSFKPGAMKLCVQSALGFTAWRWNFTDAAGVSATQLPDLSGVQTEACSSIDPHQDTTYTASVLIGDVWSPPGSTRVTAPDVAAGKAVNAASLAGGVTPGSLFTVFVDGMLPRDDQQVNLPGNTVLGGTSVKICGLPARLFYRRSVLQTDGGAKGQLNGLVPAAAAGGTCDVVVTDGPRVAAALRVPLAENPALFTFTTSTGQVVPIITDAGYRYVVKPEHVAALPPGIAFTAGVGRGQTLTLWMTGFAGPLNPPVPEDGNAPLGAQLVNPPVVKIGGVAAKVLYAGYAPGLPGLFQVNVVVPEGMGPGEAPLWFGNEPAGNIYSLTVVGK
jgi:uncharacterized protein (TIGR03437 family)